MAPMLRAQGVTTAVNFSSPGASNKGGSYPLSLGARAEALLPPGRKRRERKEEFYGSGRTRPASHGGIQDGVAPLSSFGGPRRCAGYDGRLGPALCRAGGGARDVRLRLGVCYWH